MYYIVETGKPFDQATDDLAAAVVRHEFGVLHVHDIGETLRNKGVEFDEQCKVFEVCNPLQAAKLMAADVRMNMVLPCRISVYTKNGKTCIGLVRTVPMMATLTEDAAIGDVALEVEKAMIRMVDEAS